MNYQRYTYSEEQLTFAVKNSNSIRQVLIKLNVTPSGGSYSAIKRLIKKLNLNTSHFLGRGSNKDRKFGPKRPISDYLSNSFGIGSNRLKKRLIKEKIIFPVCNCCGNTKWLNHPIPLELHHRNGNHEDNSLENVEVLCPNCHALTNTYRGKNSSQRT